MDRLTNGVEMLEPEVETAVNPRRGASPRIPSITPVEGKDQGDG
jgi:hypothetical protein